MEQTVDLGWSGDGWTLNTITFTYDGTDLIAGYDGTSEYKFPGDAPKVYFAASGNVEVGSNYTTASTGFSAQRASVIKDGPPYTIAVGDSRQVDVTEAVEAVLPVVSDAKIQVTEAGTSLWGSVEERDFVGSAPNLGSLGRVTPGQEAAIEVAATNFGESAGTETRTVTFNGEQVGVVEFDLPPGESSRALVRFVVPPDLSAESVPWSAGRREFESAVDLPEDDPTEEQSKLEVQNFRALSSSGPRESAVARFEVVNVPLTSSGAREPGTVEVTLDGEVVWEESVEVDNRQSKSFEVTLDGVEPGNHEVCARVR